MKAFPHQQRADRSLRPGARTLRSRHSVLVQIAGNGVRRLALRALPHNAGPPRRLASTSVGRGRHRGPVARLAPPGYGFE